jgi:hypothetical protein
MQIIGRDNGRLVCRDEATGEVRHLTQEQYEQLAARPEPQVEDKQIKGPRARK